MATNALFPVHALNKYLWDKIVENDILTTVPYQGVGLVPIVPVEEVPVLMQAIDSLPGVASYPFIVYNWTRVNVGQQWFVKVHEIAYALRSDDNDKTSLIIDLFDKEFEDYDQAAQRVNQYIAGLPQPTRLSAFSFKYINISTLGGPLPADDQNSPKESVVTLRVAFTES